MAYAKSTGVVLAFDSEIRDQSQAEFLRFCPIECNLARHVTCKLMGGGSWQPVSLKCSFSACLKPSLRPASVFQMQSAVLKSLQSWEDVSLVRSCFQVYNRIHVNPILLVKLLKKIGTFRICDRLGCPSRLGRYLVLWVRPWRSFAPCQRQQLPIMGHSVL